MIKTIIDNYGFKFKSKIITGDYNFMVKFKVIVNNYDFIFKNLKPCGCLNG